MPNLKFANLYTLKNEYDAKNFIVIETANNDEELHKLNISNIAEYSEFSVKKFDPNFGNAQQGAIEFGKAVDKLIDKSNQETVFVVANADGITYSGSTDTDIADLRKAVNAFLGAFVSSYNDAFNKGYAELSEEELASDNLFTEDEVNQFADPFEQFGYNTGKRVGYDEARLMFSDDWGA